MTAAREPDPFRDTFLAIAAARAVITATRLGVFASLADAPASADELAGRLKLEPAGVEALLTALATLGYLDSDDTGTYKPTAAGLQLVPNTADSVAHFVGAYNTHAWQMLAGLDDVLADARRAQSHALPEGDPFWEPYIRGLFELARHELDAAAALVPATDPSTLLDIAGGHGGFSMAMCRRFPQLRATVLDLPASAAVGRQIVAEQGFADRITFREGDALSDPLGKNLELISIFNLLHHLDAQAVLGLLTRAREALGNRSYLVIGETERPEAGQRQSLGGALSALVYFASSGTRNYSRAELTGWLEQAGFAAIEVHRNERSPWRLMYVART